MTSRCTRIEWSDKPGLWDPYLVSRTCVQVLMRNVYPRFIKPKRATKVITLSKEDFCPGVLIYLEPENVIPEIDSQVDSYINFPCQSKMLTAINDSNGAALQFLTTYLRRRGPFLRWPLSASNVDISTSSAKSVQWATQKLRHVHELDCCAATVIGRYLNYLIKVAEGHDLHYMSDMIAKLWGPLFLRLEPDEELMKSKKQMNPEQIIKSSVSIFRNMLHAISWDQFRPTEDIYRTIHHSNDYYMYHKTNEAGQIITDMKTIPEKYLNNICDTALRKTIMGDYKALPEAKDFTTVEKLGLENNAFKTDDGIDFPPDSCDISFSTKRPGENYL